MGFRKNKYMTGMSSRKNAMKSLSVAVLAGCAMFGAPALAQDVTTDIPTIYGTGDSAKYYKWETNATTGNTTLVETTIDDAEITANYDSSNPQNWLYNKTDISSTPIVGSFVGLSLPSSVTVGGGAILNGNVITNATIGNITADFVQNSAIKTDSKGGAILNYGTIGDITGDFIGNRANKLGGAISNYGTIGDITGDFIGNRANESGGAISNYGTIGDITGDFVGNYAKSTGGAIYNARKYINNNNIPTINSISGKFIGNSASFEGAAIANNGIIRSITSEFVDSNVELKHGLFGGIIFNTGVESALIEELNSNFENNTVTSASDIIGGIIHNENGADIVQLTSEFVNNNIETEAGLIQGGIIYNSSFGTIEELNSNFENNTVKSNSGNIEGGIIYNAQNTAINSVNGNFINNRVESNSGSVFGGVIYNSQGNGNLGELGTITGNFVGNSAKSNNGSVSGGAIYFSTSNVLMSFGSVMSGYYTITNDDGSVYQKIYMLADSKGKPLSEADFIANVEDGSVFTVQDYGNVGAIPKSEWDAMIADMGSEEQLLEEFGLIQTDPNLILAEYGVGNSLFNSSFVRKQFSHLHLLNSNIVDNFTESVEGEAQGGAIYAENVTVKLEANNGETTIISGNYTKNGDVIDDNAIYMNGGNLVFDVTNGSTIQLDDNINGENNYETYIIGDNASKFVLNNKIKNSTTHLVETNLYLLNDSNLDGNNLKLHSGMLSMINNQAGISALDRLVVTGDTNVNVDVDLANKTMDRFTASEYGSHSGNLNVTSMNLLSDAVDPTTEILFAEQGLKDNVTNGLAEVGNGVVNAHQTVAYTPIYKYNVSYDNRDDAGYFVFARPTASGSESGSANAFNPAILGSSSTATVGALGTMNQTMNYAFGNLDTYMNIPYLERVSMKNRNKYALSLIGDGVDMGRYSPLYQPSQEEASVWVKPYATFENVPLKNGPKVSNITYGTLIGFDSEMQSLRNGWDRVWTGYIGYNGASQRYSGIDSTQNGGLIGGTMTLYKGNFFNATTVSVGANVAQNQTMYGSEDFAMLLSGIGNKTGYNFEFKEGKVILQPSMLMSYTFVNTFDYTNAAGVRIDNKPLHALQLAPGVKVIGNLKNGWQPYASVSMVWNLMGESDATANGVKLPEMSIKPYVQYGVGLQKRIKDHFMAYGQAMIQNGGRNGISLTAGFRWALGHDCKYKVDKSDKSDKLDKLDKLDKCEKAKNKQTLSPTLSVGEGAKKEILRSAQNDRGNCHYEERSDVVISSNNAIATPSARNDRGKTLSPTTQPKDTQSHLTQSSSVRLVSLGEGAKGSKKIVKQMTPSQKAAHGGKYASTTRSAKAGMLRQL